MLLLAITAWLRALARLWRAGDWSCCARTPGKQQRHSSLDCDASHAIAGWKPSRAAVCWIQRALLRMGTRAELFLWQLDFASSVGLDQEQLLTVASACCFLSSTLQKSILANSHSLVFCACAGGAVTV